MTSTLLAAGIVTTMTLLGGATAAGAATGTGDGSGANGIPAQSIIQFPEGSTTASVSGRVAAGEDRRYVIDARKGQTATFQLERSTSPQTWTLVGPSGPAVHDADSPRQSDSTYRLPETGRYSVDITSTRPATYSLIVEIRATTSSTTPSAGTGTGTGTGTGGGRSVVAEATKLTFAPGATSTRVKTQVGPRARSAHTFSAKAGQGVRIQLAGASTAALSLIAPDGTPLHTTSSRNQSDVTVELPTTGLYRIDVQPPERGRSAAPRLLPWSDRARGGRILAVASSSRGGDLPQHTSVPGASGALPASGERRLSARASCASAGRRRLGRRPRAPRPRSP